MTSDVKNVSFSDYIINAQIAYALPKAKEPSSIGEIAKYIFVQIADLFLSLSASYRDSKANAALRKMKEHSDNASNTLFSKTTNLMKGTAATARHALGRAIGKGAETHTRYCNNPSVKESDAIKSGALLPGAAGVSYYSGKIARNQWNNGERARAVRTAVGGATLASCAIVCTAFNWMVGGGN